MSATAEKPTTKFFLEQLEYMEKEAIREIRQREWVYPRSVSNGKMTQKSADNKILLMQKILELIEEQKKGALSMKPTLFSS